MTRNGQIMKFTEKRRLQELVAGRIFFIIMFSRLRGKYRSQISNLSFSLFLFTLRPHRFECPFKCLCWCNFSKISCAQNSFIFPWQSLLDVSPCKLRVLGDCAFFRLVYQMLVTSVLRWLLGIELLVSTVLVNIMDTVCTKINTSKTL